MTFGQILWKRKKFISLLFFCVFLCFICFLYLKKTQLYFTSQYLIICLVVHPVICYPSCYPTGYRPVYPPNYPSGYKMLLNLTNDYRIRVITLRILYWLRTLLKFELSAHFWVKSPLFEQFSWIKCANLLEIQIEFSHLGK